jgi:histidine triad (HIT) family protein
MATAGCGFCDVIEGRVEVVVVARTEHTLAFLDRSPVFYGHTLVIPKEAVATLDELSDESAAALGRALPRISRAVLAATGTRDFNVLQNNGARAHQAVFHVHFHIIPKADDGRGLGLGWKPLTIDDDEAAKLAADVSRRLAS